MQLDKVTRDDWTIGGLALLLVIDLLLLPFFSPGFAGIDINLTGTDAPDGWLGVLAVLAGLALIADLAIERLSPQTSLPALGGSRTTTRFILAAAAAVFIALKFLFQISHFSDLGYGFWLVVIIAGALVYFTMRQRSNPGISTPLA